MLLRLWLRFVLRVRISFSRNSQFFLSIFYCVLVGFDVVNMFPNIDNKSGLLSVKEALTDSNFDVDSTQCIVANTISLSRHEQVCLMRLRFERYFSHHRAR